MKIENAKTERLRNEEHFQFHKGVIELIELTTSATLHVEEKYAVYRLRHADETEALDLIRKNSISDKLLSLDTIRDKKFRSFKTYLTSLLTEDDEQVVASAKRLLDLFKFYGNIARKSYDEETGALHSLIGDLRGKYAADVTLITATGRVNSLDNANITFEELMKTRYSSEAAKTELRMKGVRIAIDDVYGEIVEYINSAIVVNGEEGYTVFVKELNERIYRVNQVLAQRGGSKGDDDEESDSEN